MKFVKLYSILCICLHTLVVSGQDIHFSQYFNTPLMINPAFAGEFKGKIRLIANYRNQWSSITSNPFKTIAFSADKSFYNKQLSAGLFVFNDKAGDANMGISQMNLSTATRVNISNKDYLKGALQAGFAQRTINVSAVTWDSQFDGMQFDINAPSGERTDARNFLFFDVSAGMLWNHVVDDQKYFNAGLASFHIAQPNYSYYSGVRTRLHRRWCFNADASISVKHKNYKFLPSLLIMKQGTTKEITLGLVVRYMKGLDSEYTGNLKSSSVYFGSYYRYGDALILYTRMDYQNKVGLALSYDLNLSKLHVVSHVRGGLELSLFYNFNPPPVTVKTDDGNILPEEQGEQKKETE